MDVSFLFKGTSNEVSFLKDTFSDAIANSHSNLLRIHAPLWFSSTTFTFTVTCYTHTRAHTCLAMYYAQ